MAAVDYPDTVLPKPLVANASHSEESRLSRTTMDSGYRVVRKRFTKVPAIFDVKMLYEQNDLSAFQGWYMSELDYGLNWFNMDLPVGEGLESSHECRFLKEPKYVLQGMHWSVTFRLEALELNVGTFYDEVMLGVIATLGGVRGFDTASTYLDKLDVAINITYPASGYGPDA